MQPFALAVTTIRSWLHALAIVVLLSLLSAVVYHAAHPPRICDYCESRMVRLPDTGFDSPAYGPIRTKRWLCPRCGMEVWGEP